MYAALVLYLHICALSFPEVAIKQKKWPRRSKMVRVTTINLGKSLKNNCQGLQFW